MGVQPSDQIATPEPETADAARQRKLRLDEMLAERDAPALPPAPVLTVEPAPVDAAPVGAGRRGALKRVAELEALARRNLRAAEEARRVVREERVLLEEQASARSQAERTAAALRRELDRLRSTEQQRAAQARFAATHEARSELASEIERVHEEHSRVVDELDRLRGTLFDHDSLLDEYSQRLHEEQAAQAMARAELVRAEEARRSAERSLEIATETARRRAEDDLARLAKAEESLQRLREERDRAVAELTALTTGDGEIARLRRDLEAAREDMTRLMADVDAQSVRADRSEKQLAAAREACTQAEKVATESVAARDAALEALESTRAELTGRIDALDGELARRTETLEAELARRAETLEAERATSETTIADLRSQLTSTTRAAEIVTQRVAELEVRHDEAVRTRDEAVARTDDLVARLDRALADAEQLRTHAATIGDELAATQHALDEARRPVVQVAPEAFEDAPATDGPPERSLALVPGPEPGPEPLAGTAAPSDQDSAPAAAAQAGPTEVARPGESGATEARPTEPGPGEAESTEVGAAEVQPTRPTRFDVAIASAFGEAIPPAPRPQPARVRAGGPVVEREAALVREALPVPDAAEAETAETSPEPKRKAPAWRRTAMAELTALATDSDDLTPRRRR